VNNVTVLIYYSIEIYLEHVNRQQI